MHSTETANVMSDGRLFQSLMVLGKNDCCLYVVAEYGMVKALLLGCLDLRQIGISLFFFVDGDVFICYFIEESESIISSSFLE